jgi:hypothetical protein
MLIKINGLIILLPRIQSHKIILIYKLMINHKTYNKKKKKKSLNINTLSEKTRIKKDQEQLKFKSFL